MATEQIQEDSQELSAEQAEKLIDSSADEQHSVEDKAAHNTQEEQASAGDEGDSAPEGWAPGAYQRFKEVNEENGQLKEKLKALEAEAQKVPEFKEKLETIETTYQQNVEMMKLGGNFSEPKIQKIARQEFQEFKDESGKDLSFSEFLNSEHAKTNPVLAPHFPKEKTKKEIPNPNKGTDQEAGAPVKRFSAKDIRNIRNKGQWERYKDDILAQLRNEGKIK